MKGLLKEGEYAKATDLLIRTGEVLREELKSLGLTLVDFKMEFGFDEERNIYIVDEITPDIWRVKDADGNIPDQIECAKIVLARINAV